MTTTPSRTPATDVTPAGTGTARLLAAVAVTLAPVLFAVANLLIPYDTNGSSKEIARDIAAHQGVTELAAWLWTVGTVLFLPGIVAVGLLATARSPRLGLWGAALFGTGLVAIGTTPSLDTVALGAYAKGVRQEDVVRMADGVNGLPVVGGPILYFVVAHVVGAILLGVALLRGRAIPAWAAWLLILSMPINAAAYLTGLAPLTAASFLMLAIGCGYAGLTFTRHGTGWTRTA
ncbi:hypothetical protein ABZ896_47795 [Streptomyces sp. NPDC047072]|uniref:hypothetical protein n=1 Tax=Streptomyces sp. NPDC047072 TaxID=3154809 RepID=UPI0033F55BC0